MQEDLTLEEIWSKINITLKTTMSTPGYETFRTAAKPLSFSDGILLINVPNDFTKNWLKERVEQSIKDTLFQDLSMSVLIDFKVSSTTQEEPKNIKKTMLPFNNTVTMSQVNESTYKKTAIEKVTTNTNNLNTKYTFETFVVGQSNRFAHAAALAVAAAPGKAYNPLFLYGGVGLGKTHLMHAIGIKALESNPSLKILYVSSETFTNELINSIRDDKTTKFREKYRNIDILLIDDIQFLAGKERTQEEFFHTFNALHEYNKQIVISSDRPPKDIPTLEDRLKSRFDWGLSTDVQAPELETRIAILKKKAELEDTEIASDVLNFIATQIPSNIRELEGALIRIIAYASLIKQPISSELATDVIKDIVAPQKKKPISIDLIKKAVSKYFNISVDALISKKRTKDLALYRQIAMYFARELTSTSLPRIGASFGGRDHTTVMYACDKIKELIKDDIFVKDSVNNIQSEYLN